MTKRFLVTGGAGYVGSHMVDLLAQRGYDFTVLDDLRHGHRAALPPGTELVVANVADAAAIDATLTGRSWHAIIHFAALSLVGESMRQPMRYLQENAAGGMVLIDAAIRHGVPRFLLSSTANVFGEPDLVPIPEEAIVRPSSPYGESNA